MKFNVEDYLGNPPMIEKLREEKLVAIVQVQDLQNQITSANKDIEKLKLQNQSLQHQLGNIRQRTLLIVGLSILSVILTSIGTGLIVNDFQKCAGWVLTVAGVAVELFAVGVTGTSKNGTKPE
jgi:membrane-bound ClpP family serine protease